MDKKTFLYKKYINNKITCINNNIQTDVNNIELNKEYNIVFNEKLIRFLEIIPNNTTNFFIFHDVALGDNIACNGMIRFLSTKFTNIIIACQKKYYDQLKDIYSDLSNILFYILEYSEFNWYIHYKFSNNLFNIITFSSNPSAQLQKIINQKNINFRYNNDTYNSYNSFIEDENSKSFPNRVYKQYNININIRYNYFKVNRDINNELDLYNKLIEIVGENYIIIIDDENRNFKINIPNSIYPIFRLGFGSKNINSKLETIKTNNVLNYITILERSKEIHSIDSCILLLIDQLNIKKKVFVYNNIRKNTITDVIYQNNYFSYI